MEKREVKIAYTQAKQKCHARNRAYIALTTEPMIGLQLQISGVERFSKRFAERLFAL